MSIIMILVIDVIYQRIKKLREDRDYMQRYLVNLLSRDTYSAYRSDSNEKI